MMTDDDFADDSTDETKYPDVFYASFISVFSKQTLE
jgi:hypothetical protein